MAYFLSKVGISSPKIKTEIILNLNGTGVLVIWTELVCSVIIIMKYIDEIISSARSLKFASLRQKVSV
jgi:hypothetical protein